MQRTIPPPPTDITLSIDPGSQLCALCLFDASSQKLLHWETHKLMSVHASAVEDTAEVKAHLDSIMVVINALLQGREYHVLIERQPVDRKEV